MTFSDWVADWSKNRPQERLGQAFVNDFVKEPFPELYYARDEDHDYTKSLIQDWLDRYHYSYENMPQKIERGE